MPREACWWARDERGLGSVEYTVVAILIAAGALLVWLMFGKAPEQRAEESAEHIARMEGTRPGASGPVSLPRASGVGAPVTPPRAAVRQVSRTDARPDTENSARAGSPLPFTREFTGDERGASPRNVQIGSANASPNRATYVTAEMASVGSGERVREWFRQSAAYEVISEIREYTFSDERVLGQSSATGAAGAVRGIGDALYELGRDLTKAAFGIAETQVELTLDGSSAIESTMMAALRNPTATLKAMGDAIEDVGAAVGDHVGKTYDACANGDGYGCAFGVARSATVAGVAIYGVANTVRSLSRGTLASEEAVLGRRAAAERPPLVGRSRAPSSPGRRFLGEGDSSIVDLEGDEVIKTIKPVAQRRYALTEAQRAYVARQQVKWSNRLRNSRRLRSQIPHSRLTGPHELRMDYRDGLSLEELQARHPEGAVRARAQIEQSVEEAIAELDMPHTGYKELESGGFAVIVDRNNANFRFAPDGTLTSWIDPIVIKPPETLLIH